MEREPYNKLVQARLTEKDFKRVCDAALDEGLPVATWLRRLILEGLKYRDAKAPIKRYYHGQPVQHLPGCSHEKE
jgi:hypothetical protein